MNFRHAVGFLAVGTVFGLLPRFAPGLFEAAGVDGISARGLWLKLMSGVQIGLASGFFLQRVLAAAAIVMEFDPQRATSDGMAAPAAGESAPVALRQSAAVARMRSRAVIAAPVALEAGLLERRRAA